VVSYKGVPAYVLNDTVTLLKLGPSSPLKRWIVLGFVPRFEQLFPSIPATALWVHHFLCRSASVFRLGRVFSELRKHSSFASTTPSRVTACGPSDNHDGEKAVTASKLPETPDYKCRAGPNPPARPNASILLGPILVRRYCRCFIV
jgi:hypothetical protein